MRSRRNKNSRRNKSRSQRGGLLLSPGAVGAPTVLLPGGVGALVQGAQFAQQHLGQHGGAASVGAEMSLPSGMADAAMQGKLLSALNEIKGMSDMAGGKRRKSKKASHKGRKAGKKSKKASRKSRKSSKASKKSKKASRKSRRASRRRSQRGGQAPVTADSMLGVQAKGVHPQFNDFNKL